MKDEFFANTEDDIKGKKMVEVAKDEGFTEAVDCQGGGFTSQDGSESDASDDEEDRVDPDTLSFSLIICFPAIAHNIRLAIHFFQIAL